MAKRTNKSKWANPVLSLWWARALLALGLLALSYGFASWAIDSGSTWHYAACILLLYLGAVNLFQAVRQVIVK